MAPGLAPFAVTTARYQKAVAATTIVLAVAILILVASIARAHIHGLQTIVYLTLVVDILFCVSMIVNGALTLGETKRQLTEDQN